MPAVQGKKKRFSNNQIVVFRYGSRRLVGKVVLVRPQGKKFLYDVLCEDGKVYPDLLVDTAASQCVDTYLTKLLYAKYGIQEIAEISEEDEVPTVKSLPQAEVIESDEEEHGKVYDKEEILHDDDESDPNY